MMLYYDSLYFFGCIWSVLLMSKLHISEAKSGEVLAALKKPDSRLRESGFIAPYTFLTPVESIISTLGMQGIVAVE